MEDRLKLNENRKYPVEYDFQGGGIKLFWEDPTTKRLDTIVLDKQDRRNLLKILKEMDLETWNSAIEAAALVVEPVRHKEEERSCEGNTEVKMLIQEMLDDIVAIKSVVVLVADGILSENEGLERIGRITCEYK